MEWSDYATIGFSGAGIYSTHPLSGSLQANAIGCVHTEPDGKTGSLINNIIYDLVPFTPTNSTPSPDLPTFGMVQPLCMSCPSLVVAHFCQCDVF